MTLVMAFPGGPGRGAPIPRQEEITLPRETDAPAEGPPVGDGLVFWGVLGWVLDGVCVWFVLMACRKPPSPDESPTPPCWGGVPVPFTRAGGRISRAVEVWEPSGLQALKDPSPTPARTAG